MVTKWFSLSFLQHFAKHSYSVMFDSLCGERCSLNNIQPDTINFVQSQFEKIQALSLPTNWFGIDLDYIGSRCSIIIVIFMAINIIYSVITTILKFCVFQRSDIKPISAIARALCSELFLITKIMGDQPNITDNDNV